MDQQLKLTNSSLTKDFGADDNFYLNFFGTNLPSDTESIAIAMEKAKQLFKNSTFISDAQMHEKNHFFSYLSSFSSSAESASTSIACDDDIDCLGRGICSITNIPFFWTP